MAVDNVLKPVEESTWRSGLHNLLWKEINDWWGTRTWWVQALAWLVIVNGFVAVALFAMPDMSNAQNPQVAKLVSERTTAALSIFFLSAGYAFSIGVVIQAQDEIVGERRSGTAAWLLSKPISRGAFILSRLIGNLPGILLIMVLLQGVVAYLQISLAGDAWLPIVPFACALGLISIELIFYLSLTLMLGVLSNSRGLVMGLPLLLILGDTIFPRIIPKLGFVMPWRLPAIGAAIASNQPIPLSSAIILPVVCTAAWSLIFVIVAIWRFHREEF
jgi:ABC-2 type transport system permease protein